MIRWFPLVLLLHLAGCGDDGVSIRDDELSTKLQDMPRVYWLTSPVTADVQWRMLSYAETDDGIRVTVSLDIIFLNPSDTNYDARVSKLTFERRDMVALAVYEPEDGVLSARVPAGTQVQSMGEVEIDVESLFAANSISNLIIWTTFEAL